MRISDLFKNRGRDDDHPFGILLEKLDGEYQAAWDAWRTKANARDWKSAPKDNLAHYPTGKLILDADPQTKIEWVEYLLPKVVAIFTSGSIVSFPTSSIERQKVLAQLLQDALPFRSRQLVGLMDRWSTVPEVWQPGVREHLLTQAQALMPDPVIRRCLEQWYEKAFPPSPLYNSADVRKSRRRFESVLFNVPADALIPSAAWQQRLSEIVGEPAFMAMNSATSNTPTKKWKQQAEADLPSVPNLVSAVDEVSSTLRKAEEPVPPEYSDCLRGLAWTLGMHGGDEACEALYELAVASNRKIPDIGSVCVKAFNACVTTLGGIGTTEALSRLARLRPKLKNHRDQSLVQRTLDESATKSGVTLEELEELIVPTFELPRRLEVAGGWATLSIEGSDVRLAFENAQGRAVKSLPKDPAVNSLKKELKVIREALMTQRDRLDRLMRSPRQLAYRLWVERYLNQPVVGPLAKRLIWNVGDRSAFWTAAGWVGSNGQPVPPPGPDDLVSLWHPLTSSPDTVRTWQTYIEDAGVTQPFKQAHRETYGPTDAERLDHSTERYAGYVVRQHALAAIAKSMGWRYNLQSTGFDGHNSPTLALGDGLVAEIDVDPVAQNLGGQSEAGISLYLTVGALRFRRYESVRLGDVDPLLFSEVLREVDLFVSAPAAAHDPAFTTREMPVAPADLTGTARTRANLLPRLLKRLYKQDVAKIEGRHVVVEGRIGRYRIHLGTGNVYIEPTNRLLAISVEPGADVALPFEGDQTLSRIVALVGLLLDDDGIKDAEIRKQIAAATS